MLTALDVLGFERPTRLRRRSAGLIGLVMPELINPIFPAFAQVIESALSQRGFTPVLCTQSPSGATEDEYVEMLLERGVSGIIFVSGLHADTGADHARYQSLVERKLPVVFVNGWLAGRRCPVHLVRRVGRDGAGRLPSGCPRPPPDRVRLGAGAVHRRAAQTGRLPHRDEGPARL